MSPSYTTSIANDRLTADSIASMLCRRNMDRICLLLTRALLAFARTGRIEADILSASLPPQA